MSMDDWGWSDEATTQKSQPASEPLAPGRHVARIKAAQWKTKDRVPDKWRDRNPQGHHVLVVLEVDSQGTFHTIYAEVARHWQWLFGVICDATGTDMPTDTSWQPSEWVWQKVDIETSLYEGRKAKVEKWFPHEPGGVEAPPAKKPAARTGAAKVAAADDIPF